MAGRLPLVALVVASALVVCTDRALAEAPAAPALSEVERLKVEVLTLKAQLARAIADGDTCRVELAPTRTRLNALGIAREADALAAELEAAHPGYRVNRETWTLEAAPAKPSPQGSKP